MKKKIGAVLKDRRRNCGFLTQEGFACAIHPETNRQTVQKWENGTSFPRPDKWAKVEELLHLPTGWMQKAAGGILDELPPLVVNAEKGNQATIVAGGNVVKSPATITVTTEGKTGSEARNYARNLIERIPEDGLDGAIAALLKITGVLVKEEKGCSNENT